MLQFNGNPDFQGHTKANMDMGQVTMQTVYRKQKLNTIISTEAELVAFDDGSVYILWMVLFIEWQG